MLLRRPTLILALLLAGCATTLKHAPEATGSAPAPVKAEEVSAPASPPAEASPPPPATAPAPSAVPGAADAPIPATPAPSPPAAAEAAPSPAEAHPALWKVTRGGTTIYLFGTIHALPQGVAWEDKRITAAEGAAQGLVLETVLDREPSHAAALLFGLGKQAGLPPFLDRAPPGRRAELEALVRKSGAPLPLLDSLKTWTAALMLVAVPLAEMQLSAGDGVEPRLESVFKAAGKPIEGLETPAQQLGYFDGLSEPAQREFLGTLLDDPAKMRSDFAEMLDAWKAGDEAKIAATFDEDLKKSPELQTALVARRNAIWADWIAARLARPGTLFLAVGAGHLAGEGSVIALLKAKGIVAERLR